MRLLRIQAAMPSYRHLLAAILFSASCASESPTTPTSTSDDNFMRGADLSFLAEIEASGTQFYSSEGKSGGVLELLKERGCNTVRLRLWHSPANEHNSLTEVATMAARVKAAGMKVLLTVHYSDTWADPGQQAIPAAWVGLSLPDLKDSVYRYTKRVMTVLSPDYIQVGNEINGGLLWEQGRRTNLDAFLGLIAEGCRAVRETNPATKIIIHYAGTDGADGFFDQLRGGNIDYDLIGLSYYPMWHGFSLSVLQASVNGLIAENNKPLLIVETAYPFTLGYADYTNNIVGLPSQLIPEYPASPQGQRDFLLAIRSILEQNPKGAGFCYWGAEWVAFRGPTATDGSAGENTALFDFDRKALPVLEAFAP